MAGSSQEYRASETMMTRMRSRKSYAGDDPRQRRSRTRSSEGPYRLSNPDFVEWREAEEEVEEAYQRRRLPIFGVGGSDLGIGRRNRGGRSQEGRTRSRGRGFRRRRRRGYRQETVGRGYSSDRRAGSKAELYGGLNEQRVVCDLGRIEARSCHALSGVKQLLWEDRWKRGCVIGSANLGIQARRVVRETGPRGGPEGRQRQTLLRCGQTRRQRGQEGWIRLTRERGR
ncbi:hypothetical protein IEQ34_017200 [Dendrobium chrysotoxum]|uniref:Uncharacterized protein n=1 Tax=Dendrobium chrysotoxum TaxID=161865 RepID=A0AAV7G8Y6_DENCH|nr:hypothetical protein IEQ34_017200 [Dendrobium chrysotoxum]